MTVLKDVRTLAADAITAAVAFLAGKTPSRPTPTTTARSMSRPSRPPSSRSTKDNVKAAADRLRLLPGQRLHRPGRRRCSRAGWQAGGRHRAADQGRAALAPGRGPLQGSLDTAGYDVEILFSQGDSAKEKANVESLITKGVKVLIITPQDGTAAAAAAEAAQARRRQGDLLRPPDPRHRCGRLLRDLRQHRRGRSPGPVPGRQGRPAPATRCTCMPAPPPTTTPSSSSKAPGRSSAAQDRRRHLRRSRTPAKPSPCRTRPTLTRDEMAKIIGQVTTNWDFNTAKNLAEANLTVAQAADKGNVFILAPNDGTARSIADAFAADKDVTKYCRHRPGRREGFRPVHHRRQAVDDRPQGRPHAGGRCHHRRRRLPHGRDP